MTSVVAYRLSSRALKLKEEANRLENFDKELLKFTDWIETADNKLTR